MRAIIWPICLILILPFLLAATAIEALFYDEARQDIKDFIKYLKARGKDEYDR